MSPVLLISLVVACVPLCAGVVFLRWLGRRDMEPRRLIVTMWLFGATFGTFFGFVGAGLLGWLLIHYGELAETLVAAPLAEELAKGLGLVLLWRSWHLMSRGSGLFYGGAVGMGFATAENLVYFLRGYALYGPADWRSDLVIRTLFAAWMHVAASAAFGLWLGLAREVPLKRWQRQLAPLLGLLTAWLIHALWNGTLFLDEAIDDQGLALHLFGTVPLIAVLLLLAVERSLRAEARLAREELRPEAEAGLFPLAHVDIVASHRRRRGRAWLPGLRDRDLYVRSLLRLAEHLRAARVGGPAAAEAEAHRREAAVLRARIRGLR